MALGIFAYQQDMACENENITKRIIEYSYVSIVKTLSQSMLSASLIAGKTKWQ